MNGVPPLSIGEVLSVLQEEFPDVTISKIRFLESQGLVRPERNASGYRQFGDLDVERLTWILRQQRDHFLPLKVIKKALESGVDVHDAGAADQPTLWSSFADAAAQEAARAEGKVESEGAEPEGSPAERPRSDAGAEARRPRSETPEQPEQPEQPAPGEQPSPAERHEPSPRRHTTPADVVAALQEDPRRPPGRDDRRGPGGSVASRTRKPHAPPVRMESGARLTRQELIEAAGIEDSLLEGLEGFGLVEPVMQAGEATFDAGDLDVASAAGLLTRHGIEPRHLRIYKVAAEREAGLVEQLVVPLLKQRNPEARKRAAELASELSTLGARIHAAILAKELGGDLTG